jgi:hypothetical protein
LTALSGDLASLPGSAALLDGLRGHAVRLPAGSLPIATGQPSWIAREIGPDPGGRRDLVLARPGHSGDRAEPVHQGLLPRWPDPGDVVER